MAGIRTTGRAKARDHEVFVDPHRFDVTRANAREHLAFGAGPHFCVGAALAPMEAEVAPRRLFEEFPRLVVAGRPTPTPTSNLRGYVRVPIRLGGPTPRPVHAVAVPARSESS